MTPAELKVIEAARALTNALPAKESEFGLCNVEICELREAVWSLLAEREAGDVEDEITWGQVVEGDQIWSPKTRKWYPVISSARQRNGTMRIEAKGLPKSIKPPAAGSVKVKRGATGKAVDMWNVVWSAKAIPSDPESEEA